MPIFRNNNGSVPEPDADDITTQVLDRQKQATPDIDDMPTDLLHDDIPTSIYSEAPPTTGTTPYSSQDDPKTTISGPKQKDAKVESSSGMNDPVVGWVVITKGPGQGKSRQLGYGNNSIGRAKTERVSLDFGADSDTQISRSGHAIIEYDPKNREYYLIPGTGVNLTYFKGRSLHVPVELTGGEEIVLGETSLHFVPFCGENFDWQSNS